MTLGVSDLRPTAVTREKCRLTLPLRMVSKTHSVSDLVLQR